MRVQVYEQLMAMQRSRRDVLKGAAVSRRCAGRKLVRSGPRRRLLLKTASFLRS